MPPSYKTSDLYDELSALTLLSLMIIHSELEPRDHATNLKMVICTFGIANPIRTWENASEAYTLADLF